ncbi:probable E3 SUMO-protein ligase RNF212 isoform X2 [Leptidea sinapis]|uniref:probable E3 SUMO-protein ligase RNF212 isoform X2 n=1 Tax=Leptidea sinapis TaxID=189913 RepID=UPI00212AF54B|nr:probable E3 SUMO-protein ligase RNF212 isoform X2 [Leptidea sinapis]XP_050678865.1 probable E3 SUMO-protein ligase RNF212 isoform X2 [Leptidea sinapis]
MDWIHCNNCFIQLETGVTLHLTSCGHMFCTNCLSNGAEENACLVCRAPCTLMKLVPDMNSDIQDYFTEPEELLKKSCDIIQFQRRHRHRLLSYLLQATKKFHTARNELKRMTEICQKQHKQLKEYQRIIKHLHTQVVTQSKQVSPFSVPISPSSNFSPSFIQTTPTYKRTAKSTPYSQPFQSNLVTPTRLSKQRSCNLSAQSQRSNTSHKISSTVMTPPTPESVGYNNFLKHL